MKCGEIVASRKQPWQGLNRASLIDVQPFPGCLDIVLLPPVSLGAIHVLSLRDLYRA